MTTSVGANLSRENLAALLEGLDRGSVLATLCDLFQVRRYLEIGVDEGESVLYLLAHYRGLESVTLSDTWGNGYGGHGRGSHEHLVEPLAAYGVPIIWLDGDSAVTIPGLAGNATFDLALVDGDHSAEGCARDLCNVLALLESDGFIVVDDLDHHMHRYLKDVFHEFVEENGGEVLRDWLVGVARFVKRENSCVLFKRQ